MKKLIPILLILGLLSTSCKYFSKEDSKEPVKSEATIALEKKLKAEQAKHKAELKKVKEEANLQIQNLEQELTTSKEQCSRYKLVVGSFKEEGNAQQFSTQLESEGYKTEIIPFYDFELVSIGSFETIAASMSQLNQAIENIDEEAWIYIK